MEATTELKARKSAKLKQERIEINKITARTVFDRELGESYWTKEGLGKRIGYGQDMWALAIAKELLDNSLDACDARPKFAKAEISVVLTADSLIVRDNGRGFPEDTVKKSLNYRTATSDKAVYLSLTRGRLGNALLTVYAAASVSLKGEETKVEIEAQGKRHTIICSREVLGEDLALTPTTEEIGETEGTKMTVHWPGIAALKTEYIGYAGTKPIGEALCHLLQDYAILNPDADFSLTVDNQEPKNWPASTPKWGWKATEDSSGSPHFYDEVSELKYLIEEILDEDRKTEKRNSLKAFIRTFDGLKHKNTAEEVLKHAGLTGLKFLDELFLERPKDTEEEYSLESLWIQMQAHAKKVKPEDLGVLGKKSMVAALARHDVHEAAKYEDASSDENRRSRPYVIEVAFGVKDKEDQRTFIVGLNHSPVLEMPNELADFLGSSSIQSKDPVAMVVNIGSPKLETKDNAKNQVELSNGMWLSLKKAVDSVSTVFRRAKQEHGDLVTRDQLRGVKRKSTGETIKAVAYDNMEQAYLLASSNGTLPANARQIMYAARPLILKRMAKDSLDDKYFQALLTKYMIENKEKVQGWNVVYDARGHLVEPHVRTRLGLGTLEVKGYVGSWNNDTADLDVVIDPLFPTRGPTNRYEFALFIEKEGFDSLLESSGIARRYDLAIFSSKGQSNTATRFLVDQLSQKGVTILVAHDFDKSGIEIFWNLGHGVEGDPYVFEMAPDVRNLGLTLKDAEEMGLESEPTVLEQKEDPRPLLKDYGATEDEANFLAEIQVGKQWRGRRIELNAMTSSQFVEWLENKLNEFGADRKTMPDEQTLASAWKRADRVSRIKAEIAKIEADNETVPMPDDLSDKVKSVLRQQPELSWDQALVNIAAESRPQESDLVWKGVMTVVPTESDGDGTGLLFRVGEGERGRYFGSIKDNDAAQLLPYSGKEITICMDKADQMSAAFLNTEETFFFDNCKQLSEGVFRACSYDNYVAGAEGEAAETLLEETEGADTDSEA